MIVKLSSFSPNINTSLAPVLIIGSGIVLELHFSSLLPVGDRNENLLKTLRFFSVPIQSCLAPRRDSDLILTAFVYNEIGLYRSLL